MEGVDAERPKDILARLVGQVRVVVRHGLVTFTIKLVDAVAAEQQLRVPVILAE
jgi:hypothetical protein